MEIKNKKTATIPQKNTPPRSSPVYLITKLTTMASKFYTERRPCTNISETFQVPRRSVSSPDSRLLEVRFEKLIQRVGISAGRRIVAHYAKANSIISHRIKFHINKIAVIFWCKLFSKPKKVVTRMQWNYWNYSPSTSFFSTTEMTTGAGGMGKPFRRVQCIYSQERKLISLSYRSRDIF